ncbi:MFS transporter [Phenylobacterium immobile]|uniref:MFS transporter n=1 Tax=Phenylobacterium immobile TaxID=21 RepID=UPI000AF33045|nr:MFS transporter [Phenylobacterium immobile]
MVNETRVRPPVGLLTKILYGSGASANQIKQQGLSMLLLLFYNQVVGLDPRLVSSAIMIALVFDSVVDPLVGQISDNFRSRLGRRHPFMYTAAAPVSIAFFLIWNPPQGWSEGALFAYMLTCLLTIRLFDTFFELPSTSLAPELVSDYDGRTKLLALRQMFGILGTLTLQVSVYQIFMRQHPDGTGGVTDRAGYPGFALAAGLFIFTVILISTMGTHRQIPYLSKPPVRLKKPSVRDTLKEIIATVRNPSFGVVATAGMVLAIGTGITSSLNLYIGLFYWGWTQNQLTILAILLVTSGIFGAYMAPKVSRRLGKRVGGLTTGAISIVLMIAPIILDQLGFMPARGTDALFGILMGFALTTQAFTQATAIAIQAMIADVVEDAAVRTGRRSEGLLFSADNLFKKAVSGVGVMAAGQMLHFANFPENAKVVGVDPVVLTHLAWTYVGALICFNGGCLVTLSFYRIDRAKHEANVRTLEASGLAAREDPSLTAEREAPAPLMGINPAVRPEG